MKKILVKTYDTADHSTICNGALIKVSEKLITLIKMLKEQREQSNKILKDATSTGVYDIRVFNYTPIFLGFSAEKSFLSNEDHEVDESILEELEEYIEEVVSPEGMVVLDDSKEANLLVKFAEEVSMNDDCTILHVKDFGFYWSTFAKHTSYRVTTPTIPFSEIGIE